jgi:SAM-dependent methyltransferase
MSRENLEYEFEKRGPWITKFVINGREYGGNLCLLDDPRVDQFFQYFPKVHTVLELGSLEGAHTFKLARHPTVKWVLGIEGRQANIDKARFVQKLLRVDNVNFIRANLESVDLSAFGKFDAVFCVGLLYHLPEPWKLINQIPRVSTNLFIWTHYARECHANEIVDGFRGMMYQEQGLDDPLSGLSPYSFWPTLSSLKNMLKVSGFKIIHIIEKDPNHPHGPCVTLAATTDLDSGAAWSELKPRVVDLIARIICRMKWADTMYVYAVRRT